MLFLLLHIQAISTQNGNAGKAKIVGQFMLNYKEANLTNIIWTKSDEKETIFDDEDLSDLVHIYDVSASKFNHISVMKKVPPLNESSIMENLIVISNSEAMKKVSFSSEFLANNVILTFVDDEDDQIKNYLRIDSNFYVFKVEENILYEMYELNSVIKTVKYAEFNESQNSLVLKSQKSKWNRRSDLNGMVLKATFVDIRPQVYINEDGSYEGIMYDVINTLGK